MTKRPIFIITPEGKSKEQLKTEARQAFQTYLEAKRVT